MIRAGTRMIRAKPGWYGRGPGWSGQTKLLQPRNWNRHNFYIRTPILMILGSFWSYEKKPRSSHREPPKMNQNGGCKICKGFIMYLGNLFGFGFSLVYRIWVELCREDVDLSKSITNPFDPLLIVRDPYNSRIIKGLHYIAINNPFLSVCVLSVFITPQH